MFFIIWQVHHVVIHLNFLDHWLREIVSVLLLPTVAGKDPKKLNTFLPCSSVFDVADCWFWCYSLKGSCIYEWFRLKESDIKEKLTDDG